LNPPRILSTLRTLLLLGRVSNLPTVWSNCLAGWWLGGGGHHERLPWLFAATTLLYIGGMFWNDAFDEEFDREFRKERPIPSGAISREAVWRLGMFWLAAGALCLVSIGRISGVLGLLLLSCIVIYDAVHKRIRFAPVLMGLCRFLLYVVAASTGLTGVTGISIWCGLALTAYVIGLSYLARRESTPGRPSLRYAPLILLAVPPALALAINQGPLREKTLLLSAIFILWVVLRLRPTFWSNMPNLGRTVSGLLAGIVLVDWLAVPDAPRELGFVFLGLFIAANLFQRIVPAT
jgi:4-hydroxybenzoate polyprenyltransferase